MAADASQPDVLLGSVLDGRYRLDEAIGEGGIGRVYRARHLKLGSAVAVKVLLAEHEDREVLRQRFEREAQALAELSHPNIVKVADFGLHDDVPFLVMELLEGDDLAALLRRGEIDPARGVAIVRQVLRALAHAHARDVVHRDVKPHNVFVRSLADGTDHVQVLDFGLARFLRPRSRGGRPLTRTGTVLGTPAYMAPEQASGEAVGPTADVYSVGVMLYEVLCGTKPFEGERPSDLLRAHLLQEPPDPLDVAPDLELPAALRDALFTALEKPKDLRFADAGAMLAALDAIAEAPRRSGAPTPTADEHLASANTLPAAVTPATAATAVPMTRPAIDPTPPVARAERPASVAAGPAIALALVAVLAMVAVALAGGAWWLMQPEPTGPESLSRIPPSLPPPSPFEDPVPARPAPAAARDPFAGPLPEPLAALHAKVERGRELSRRERATLNQYAAEHVDDPRPRLILAHNFVAARSLSWALPEYDAAITIDPTVRGDPQMLPDLLEIARTESLHDEAVRRIVAIYGRDALPAVEAQLQQRLRPPEEDQLEALAAQLRAL